MQPRGFESLLECYPAQFRPQSWSLPYGPGYSGAFVLRIETEAGPCCLRGWPPEADAGRLAGLHRLLAHVRSQGIEFVAVPLPAKDGATLVWMQDRWWQLEPWLSGKADFAARPSPARLAAASTALARVHDAMARFQPALEDQKWFRCVPAAVAPAVEERFERLQGWTPDKLDTVRQQLRDDADSPPAWDPAIAARFRAASVSILDGFA